MPAGFVDQLAALQLSKNILALGIDEHCLDLVIEVAERKLVLAASGQFGTVETLDVASPKAVDQAFRQASFSRELVERLHDRVDGGAARGELGLALLDLLRRGDLGEAE